MEKAMDEKKSGLIDNLKQKWQNSVVGRWNKLTPKQKKITTIVSSILGVFLIIMVTIVSFNFFFSNTLVKITVRSEAGSQEVVSGASVRIGTKTARTDAAGNATISGVRDGLYEVIIEHPNYSTYNSDLTINSNNRDSLEFFIASLSVASIEGIVEAENGILLTDSVSIRAGDQTAELNDDGTFQLSGIPIETTQVAIESAEYADIIRDVTLTSGKNALGEFVLVPAYDLELQVNDFFTKQPIIDAKATYGSMEFVANDQGVITVNDILIQDEDQTAILYKAGYNAKTVLLPQDKDDTTGQLENIDLVKEGRVLYTSEREGISNVYTANYDGTGEVKISTGAGSSTKPEYSDSAILYYGSSETPTPLVFRATGSGDQPSAVSIPPLPQTQENQIMQEFYFLPPQKKLRYTSSIENDTTKISLSVSDLTGTNQKEVFQTSYDNKEFAKEIRSLHINDSGSHVTFIVSESQKTPFKHLKSSVVEYSITTGAIKTLLVDESESTALNVLGVSGGNDYVVTVNTTSAGVQEVAVINTSSNRTVEYENLSIFELATQISDDSRYLYFISVRDGKSDIYRLPFQTGEIQQITSTGDVDSFYIDTNDVLQFQRGQDMYLLDTTSSIDSVDPVGTPISSNFKMWSTL